MREKKYFLKIKTGDINMEPINWSRIIGWGALVAQAINFGLVYFAQYIPADVAIIAAGVLAGIQAITGRVQGSAK